jgi:hypothetical protein
LSAPTTPNTRALQGLEEAAVPQPVAQTSAREPVQGGHGLSSLAASASKTNA